MHESDESKIKCHKKCKKYSKSQSKNVLRPLHFTQTYVKVYSAMASDTMYVSQFDITATSWCNANREFLGEDWFSSDNFDSSRLKSSLWFLSQL